MQIHNAHVKQTLCFGNDAHDKVFINKCYPLNPPHCAYLCKFCRLTTKKSTRRGSRTRTMEATTTSPGLRLPPLGALTGRLIQKFHHSPGTSRCCDLMSTIALRMFSGCLLLHQLGLVQTWRWKVSPGGHRPDPLHAHHLRLCCP